MANTRVTTPVTNFDKTNQTQGLKLPSGTNSSQPIGVDAIQGMLRNDTEETVDSSASTLTHYNGTEWKYFAATESADPIPYESPYNNVLYTGSGDTTNGQSITGIGFKPDLVWFKSTGTTYYNVLYDSIRGTNAALSTNLTNSTYSNYNRLQSFDNDGFTIKANNAADLWKIDRSSEPFVAWCFKAGGVPSGSDKVSINGTSYATMAAASLTDGTIPIDKLSVNTNTGFSIASYNGNQVSGATVAHALGVEPEMIIVKNLQTSVSWGVWTAGISDSEVLRLDQTAAKTAPATAYFEPQNNTGDVFSLGTNDETNHNYDYIAYCFASIPGFSKIGTYVGNGNVIGPIVTLGFEPAFLMYKCVTQVGNWIMVDNKRATSNPRTPHLRANTNGSDDTGANEYVDFTSTGFQPKGVSNYNNNSLNQTYIYLAFA